MKGPVPSGAQIVADVRWVVLSFAGLRNPERKRPTYSDRNRKVGERAKVAGSSRRDLSLAIANKESITLFPEITRNRTRRNDGEDRDCENRGMS